MKSLEELEEEYPNTRVWDDSKTLDYELPESEDTFINQLINFSCPRCEGSVIDGNQDMLRGLPKMVKGANLTCNHCKLALFVHEPVQST